MNYNQETAYYAAHCLEHDVIDIFTMITDCALEPKSHIQADVAMWKNSETHKVDELMGFGEDFNNSIFKIAFGNSGLGMPLKGYKGNVDNLIVQNLQKFQIDNISPNKIIVAASGVENHDEFVDLAESLLSNIPKVEGNLGNIREKTAYKGGEIRNLTNSNDIHMAILLPSVIFLNFKIKTNWSSPDVFVYKIAEKLLEINNGRIAKESIPIKS